MNEIPNLYLFSLNLIDAGNEFVKKSLMGAINNYINALYKMVEFNLSEYLIF